MFNTRSHAYDPLLDIVFAHPLLKGVSARLRVHHPDMMTELVIELCGSDLH